MTTARTAGNILERDFLEIRCRILDLAASLDRIERAEGASEIDNDPRRKQLEEGIRILLSDGTDRAERVQILFSDPYDEGWNK